MYVGGWDTALKKAEYEELFYNQQATMEKTTYKEITSKIDDQAPSNTSKVIFISSKQKNLIENKEITNFNGYNVVEGISSYDFIEEYQSKEEFNLSILTIKEGCLTTHMKFGEGIITKIDKLKKHVRVKFESGEKTFLFPDAFIKGFLKMKD